VVGGAELVGDGVLEGSKGQWQAITRKQTGVIMVRKISIAFVVTVASFLISRNLGNLAAYGLSLLVYGGSIDTGAQFPKTPESDPMSGTATNMPLAKPPSYESNLE
jgi:hypothetical protein